MTKEQKNCSHEWEWNSNISQNDSMGEVIFVPVTCKKCDLEAEAHYRFDKVIGKNNKELETESI